MSAVKQKPKQLLWPITKDAEQSIVQSKLKAVTQSAGNLLEQFTIGIGFTADWLRKWVAFFQTITKHNNANPKQTPLLLPTLK